MLERGQHCTQGGLCTGELIFKRWIKGHNSGGYVTGHVYGWLNELDCIRNGWDSDDDNVVNLADSKVATSYGKHTTSNSTINTQYEKMLGQRRCPRTTELTAKDVNEFHCERRYQETHFGT
jgi:hypothetical protein